MATDPRPALDRLVAALEAHLAAAQRRQGDDDPAVEAAYIAVADAFEVYEEALYTAYDEVTPFELFVEDDDEDDDEDADDDEDDDEDADDDADDDDEDDDLDDDAPEDAGPGTGGRVRRR